jgi:hypothetical protein
MTELPELTLPVEHPANPADFEGAKLFSSDFDGTQCQSFEPSPGGIGVNEAYRKSIRDIYGAPALAAYIASGEHNNRTPIEIAASLVSKAKDVRIFEQITVMTQLDYAPADIIKSLSNLNAAANGRYRSKLDPEELEAITKLLTDVKLEYLLSQVGLPFEDGDRWPRPTNGYLAFSAQLEAARTDGEQITTATISAGHHEFIHRVYELWQVPPPDILISTELLGQLGLMRVCTPAELSKPSPLLMDIARQQWLRNYDLPHDFEHQNQVLYVGDDCHKDGGLARNSDVDFIHINPDDTQEGWQSAAEYLGIGAFAGRTAVNHAQ